MNASRAWLSVCGLVVCVSLVSTASADTFGTGGNQITIDFVPISGSTNLTVEQANEGDLDGFGIVNNDYRMGTMEITNDQWNKFEASLGVPVTGDPLGAYNVSPTFTGTNVPVIPEPTTLSLLALGGLSLLRRRR